MADQFNLIENIKIISDNVASNNQLLGALILITVFFLTAILIFNIQKLLQYNRKKNNNKVPEDTNSVRVIHIKKENKTIKNLSFPEIKFPEKKVKLLPSGIFSKLEKKSIRKKVIKEELSIIHTNLKKYDTMHLQDIYNKLRKNYHILSDEEKNNIFKEINPILVEIKNNYLT